MSLGCVSPMLYIRGNANGHASDRWISRQIVDGSLPLRVSKFLILLLLGICLFLCGDLGLDILQALDKFSSRPVFDFPHGSSFQNCSVWIRIRLETAREFQNRC